MISNDLLQKYFLNDQYNENVINKYFPKLHNSMYTHALTLQKNIQNTIAIDGNMKDFKIDPVLNQKYLFPTGSYTLQLTKNVIPYYHEQTFLKKYKNKAISLMDIMEDSEFFSRMLLFKIGQYNFFMLYVLATDSGTILMIKPNSNDGLSPTAIKNFISTQTAWYITIVNQTDHYYTYQSKTTLFSNITIPLSKFTTKTLFNKPTTLNNWNIYMTNNSAEPNLLVTSTCTQVTNPDTTKAFKLSQEYYNHIFASATTCKCFVINTYQKTGFCKFLSASGLLPIIQIPFDVNPVAKENITVWEYNSVTDTRGKRIPNNIVVTYPNIYNFQAMYTSKDLYIEWYNNAYTLATFDNNFKNYMNCYASTFVASIVNKTAPASILNYTPAADITYSYTDYRDSPFFGDLRGYRLNKVMEMLKDNPLRYREFMREIYAYNRDVILGSYTKVNNPVLFSTSIFSNDGQQTNPYFHFAFNEAHTYFAYKNSTDNRKMSAVYIDGKRVKITYEFTCEYITYVYFPRKYLSDTSVVTIEVSMANIDKKADTSFTIYNTTDGIFFPESSKFGKVAFNDLIFYHTDTKAYIPLSDMILRLRVSNTLINNPSTGQEVRVPHTDTTILNAYTTATGEIYKPTDAVSLLIESDVTSIEFGNAVYEDLETVDDLFYKTVDEELFMVTSVTGTTGFHKKVDSTYLTISTNNTGNLNNAISVTNADFYRQLYISNITLATTYTMINFTGEKNKNRIRVFVGGLLIDPSYYTVAFPVLYGGTLSITITGYTIGTDLSAIIEYVPFKRELLYNAVPDSTVYHNGMIYLEGLNDLASPEIYVEGNRINPHKIHPLPINDAIKIDSYIGGKLTIFTLAKDEDCYNGEYTDEIMTNIAKTDSVFSTYITSL